MAKSQKTGGKKSRRIQSKRGGAGAAEFGVSVFGAAGQQTAQPGSNVIQLKTGGALSFSEFSGASQPVVAPVTQVAPVVSLVAPVTKGGNALTDVAVPALLVIANNTIGKKLSKRKIRGGACVGGVDELGNACVVEAPVVVEAPAAAVGGSILNDIAVPAVLLYANHAYGRKKRSTIKVKGGRKSRGGKSRRAGKR